MNDVPQIGHVRLNGVVFLVGIEVSLRCRVRGVDSTCGPYLFMPSLYHSWLLLVPVIGSIL
jgi:hypothetical protein